MGAQGQGSALRRRVVRVVVAVLLLLIAVLAAAIIITAESATSGDLDGVRSHRPGLRVLFVGNSFTSKNDLVGMLQDLARGDPGAPDIFPVAFAPGGSQLRHVIHDGRLIELLVGQRWDDVVLQEQSQIPSRPGMREMLMFPPATALDQLDRKIGARTVLFMTWSYRNGDRPAYPSDTYWTMQTRLIQGYGELRTRLGAAVAPVGMAWRDAVTERPGVDLWAADGRHPNRAGSYLAACVFYALLTGRDPQGSRYTAGLDPSEAYWLRSIAFRWAHAYAR